MSETHAKTPDLKRLKPYGDIMGDGTVQICFTLPVEASPEAREAAVQLVTKMGLTQVKVATMEKVGEGFSTFVIYANVQQTVDFTAIEVVKVEAKKRARDEIDEIIKTRIGRKLVVLGACTGFDAHTVGIDAIMNMKGFAGDYGLERYQGFEAKNLGAQVLNEDLLKRAVELKADAILVSKVVTQHNIHIKDLKDLVARAKKRAEFQHLIFVAGGPRVTHPLALECGFDAGFGVGTKPSDVASYIVEEYCKRNKIELPVAGQSEGVGGQEWTREQMGSGNRVLAAGNWIELPGRTLKASAVKATKRKLSGRVSLRKPAARKTKKKK